MKTRVLIANAQHHARVDRPRVRALVAWLLERAAALTPGTHFAEVSVALVDDANMAPINKRFLRHDGPTDVISFTFPAAPGTPGASAEVLVNVQRAVEVAQRRRLDPSRELALYLAHGCQHLAGRDDRTPALRAAMRRVETTWLRTAARAGLIRDLLAASVR